MIVVLLFCPLLVFSQAQPSLPECLQQAFSSSRMLQIADFNLLVGKEKTAAARSQQLPTLQLSGVYTHIGKVTTFSIPMGPGGNKTTFSFGTPNKVNGDLKLQMALFTWGRIKNTIALSGEAERLTDLQKRVEMLNLTDQVLRAFYAVMLNQEIIKVHQSNLERVSRQNRTTQIRYDKGEVSQLDVLRNQVQYRNSQGNLTEARDNLAKSLLFLKKMIGRSDSLSGVQGTWQQRPMVETGEALLNKALTGRNELAALTMQQALNRKGQQITQSGNKPNLFGFSSYNVQNGFDPMDPTRFVDNYNFGVQLAVPLFDGFLTKHKTQEAEIEYRKLQVQQQELRDLIVLQVRQGLISVKQAGDKISVQEENIGLSHKALATAEIQYQQGVISSLDVLDSQQALLQSELLATQARFNLVMAMIDLSKAIGDYHWFENSL